MEGHDNSESEAHHGDHTTQDRDNSESEAQHGDHTMEEETPNGNVEPLQEDSSQV